jgi:hypothetical protein
MRKRKRNKKINQMIAIVAVMRKPHIRESIKKEKSCLIR